MANSILAKMAVQITANTAQFNAGLSETNKKLGGFQSGLKGLATTLGLTFGAREIFNGLKYAVGVIGDFENQMAEVKAITGATGKEFEALTKDALSLGASTRFSAKEVGGLQVAFGRLGFSTKEILAATKATITLATATGEDLAKSADVAGSTVRAFGLSADETQRVVDVMASSFNKSALGLENFSEAIKYVAPVAANANISIEQTTALLGVLADAGIRGSQAGTSLRKIISDLGQGAGPKLTQELQKMAKAGLSGAQAMDEVGRTAYASLLVLANNTKKIDAQTEAYQNSAGEARKVADVMGDTLNNAVIRLNSSYDALILSFSESKGLFSAIVEGLTLGLNGVNGGDPFRSDIIRLGIEGITEAIKDGERPRQLLIDDIKRFVNASGEPIDEAGIPSLTNKFKLSAIQADKLLQVIRELNSEVNERNLRAKNAALIPSYDVDPLTGLPTSGGDPFQGLVKPKVIRDVDFLRNAINKLNDSIGGMTSRGPIKEAQGEIKNLTIELNALLGITEKVAKVNLKDFGDLLRYSFAPVKNIDQLNKQIKELKEQLESNNDASTQSGIIKQIKDIDSEIDRLTNGISVKKPDWEKFAANFKLPPEILAALKKQFGAMGDLIDLGPAIAGFVTDFSETMGKLISGSEKVGSFSDNIKKSIGGLLQAIGSGLIALGIGKIAVKIPGPAAIAAGVVLVAAGAALSASTKKMGNVLGGGSGGGGSESRPEARVGDYQASTLNITINDGRPIEFFASGENLRAATKKGDYVVGRRG